MTGCSFWSSSEVLFNFIIKHESCIIDELVSSNYLKLCVMQILAQVTLLDMKTRRKWAWRHVRREVSRVDVSFPKIKESGGKQTVHPSICLITSNYWFSLFQTLVSLPYGSLSLSLLSRIFFCISLVYGICFFRYRNHHD